MSPSRLAPFPCGRADRTDPVCPDITLLRRWGAAFGPAGLTFSATRLMLRTHLCAGDETVAVRVHASELFGRALTSLFDVDALTVAVKSHAHPMGAAMAASRINHL